MCIPLQTESPSPSSQTQEQAHNQKDLQENIKGSEYNYWL